MIIKKFDDFLVLETTRYDLTNDKKASLHQIPESFLVADKQVKSAEKNMIAGGIAGSLAKSITAPLSRLTILYQVGPLLNGTNTKIGVGLEESIWSSVKNILRDEGVLSFWKGNFTSVIHRFPYSAINFASYEFSKNVITKKDDYHESSFTRLICGAFSGAVACVSCYPLDIIRTRLTVGTDSIQSAAGASNKFKSSSKILYLLFQIIEKEGFLGLYRGLGASLSVAVPTLSISFMVYGKIKENMLDQGLFVNPHGHLSAGGSLLAGSISGMMSSSIMFPADVIRKRMQLMGALINDSKTLDGEVLPRTHGIRYHAEMVYQNGGMRGFYRGLGPEIMKVCPMVAITFCSYETVKDLLDEYFP